MTDNEEKKDIELCAECDEQLSKDDIDANIERYDGKKICKECFSNKYFACEGCGHIDVNDDSYEAFGGTYCEDCYNDNFITCDSCNTLCDRDNIFYNENDDAYYCEECRPTPTNNNQPKFQFHESKSFKENKSKRFVGVEIETEGEGDGEANEVIKQCGEYVETKGDGSLSDEGVEFVTNPTNGDLLFDNIRKLCKAIKRDGYYIENNCGVHIHFDARDMTEAELRNIYLFYGNFEEIFFQMVPNSRRNNNYAKSIRSKYDLACEKKFKNHILNMSNNENLEKYTPSTYDSSRYDWLNMTSALSKRKSIEVRLHSGTLDHKKIINWIRINMACIEWARKADIKRVITVKNRLRTLYKIVESKDLIKYIEQRRDKFKKKLPRRKVKNTKMVVDEREEMYEIENKENKMPSNFGRFCMRNERCRFLIENEQLSLEIKKRRTENGFDKSNIAEYDSMRLRTAITRLIRHRDSRERIKVYELFYGIPCSRDYEIGRLDALLCGIRFNGRFRNNVRNTIYKSAIEEFVRDGQRKLSSNDERWGNIEWVRIRNVFKEFRDERRKIVQGQKVRTSEGAKNTNSWRSLLSCRT